MNESVSSETTLTKTPESFGGWMIVVLLGVHFSFIVSIPGLLDSIKTMDGVQDNLYNIALYEMMAAIFFLGAFGYQLYEFWKKKATFVNLFIALQVILIFYHAIDLIWLNSLVDSETFRQVSRELAKNTIRPLFNVLVWGSYLKISKRSKATFIN